MQARKVQAVCLNKEHLISTGRTTHHMIAGCILKYSSRACKKGRFFRMERLCCHTKQLYFSHHYHGIWAVHKSGYEISARSNTEGQVRAAPDYHECSNSTLVQCNPEPAHRPHFSDLHDGNTSHEEERDDGMKVATETVHTRVRLPNSTELDDHQGSPAASMKETPQCYTRHTHTHMHLFGEVAQTLSSHRMPAT